MENQVDLVPDMKRSWSAAERRINKAEQVNLLLAFALANLSGATFQEARHLSLSIHPQSPLLFIYRSRFGRRGNKNK